MINNPPPQKGFTLIETLMAVLLLSIAIAAPLEITSQGIEEATVAKDQTIAFYLAQDAVEYVRFVRDTNTLQGVDWLAGFDGTTNGNANTPVTSGAVCTGSNYCTIDSLADKVTLCGSSASSCPPINYDPATYSYSYSSTDPNGSPTLFTRAINIQTPADNSSEADLTVVVSWCDEANVCASSPRTVTVHEDLFNWQ